MGYYKVLLKSVDYVDTTTKSKYNGLYRTQPFPKSDANKRFMSLWYRYCEHEAGDNWGITTELTLDELKEFADLAAQETGDFFEVIFFSEVGKCPHESEYYGADVAGEGGYSIVGGGLFTGNPLVYYIIGEYFRERLNTYGLLSTDDAVCFHDVLIELNALDPGSIEDYDWRVFHIFRVL